MNENLINFTPPSLLERKAKISEKTLKYITHKYNYFNPKHKIKNFIIDSKNYFLIGFSYDNTILILDLHNFTTLAQIPNKNEKILWVSLNEKQDILYACFQSGLIKFWNFFTGELIFEMNRTEGYAVSYSGFSSSNQYFACAFENGQAFIFKSDDLENPIKEFNFYMPINCLTFSFGNQLIAFGLSNGSIYIVSIETEHMWKIKGHKKSVDYLIFGTNDPLILYHVSTTDGEMIGTRYCPNETKIMHIKTYLKRRLISFDFSSDETIVFCASQKYIYAFNAFNGSLIQRLDLTEIALDIIHTIRHPLIPHIVLVLSTTTLSVWNCKTSEFTDIWSVGIGDPLIHNATWIDANTIYLLMADGTINVFSANSAKYEKVENEIPKEWPTLMKKYFGEYKGNLYQKHAIEREKNILSLIPPCTVDISTDSETDSDDADYIPKNLSLY